MTDTVTAPVKPAIASKVNWIAASTAILAALNEILNQALPLIPAPYDHDVTVAITVIGAISTIIARTYYTTAITPSSAAKM